ncbi:MAG TPA: FlgD immunoglobulin-like domain containing protein [Bacteroidota bacterium]|nr:FlgD immunoglobulin-like domain containing protein [Bacteroidota bacterium]
MKKLLIFLSVLFVAAALYVLERSLRQPGERERDEELESAIGDKDDPGAALRFRHDMLAGSNPEADLPLLRQQAVAYVRSMPRATTARAGRLMKTQTTTWFPLGPGNIGGRVRAIVVNPSDTDQIIAGSVSGGIWKSTDGGASWTSKSDTLNFEAIGCLLIDPSNNNTVYAGTGEGWLNLDAVYGGGIYKSTDFGESWTLLSSTSGSAAQNFRNVMKMTSDPSGNIYAATKNYTYEYGGGSYTTSGGLYMSSDQGASWTKISSTTTSTNYFNPCDVIALTSTIIMYAVEANGPTLGGIYRTTNGGGFWSKVSSSLPTSGYGRIALAQDPNNSSVLYAAFESLDTTPAGDGGLKGIFKSTDGGATWTQLNTPPKIASTGNTSYFRDQGWYDNVIAVDPNNSSNIYLGGVDMMKSTDGGSTWNQLTYWYSGYGSPYVHADHHAIVFVRSSPNTIIDGNDGGIYKTTDGGASWSNLNNGLAITQFYGGAVYKTGATYYGGTQDNGHLKFSGTGSTWTEAVGGDGGYAAQDQTSDQVSYEEYTYLQLSKTTDGGATWKDCVSGLSDAGNSSNCLFVAPFQMNPENSSVLVAGSASVWASTNSSSSWKQVSGVFSSGHDVSAVAIANASANFLAFAGTTDGKIFRCSSLNPSSGIVGWDTITPPANNGAWVRRIVIDLSNKNNVYACYGGYNTGGTLSSRHVWYSSDQGSTWNDISTQLPNVPVHSLAIDPTTSTVLYVGTETGVFASMDRGTSWQSYADGMPTYVPTDEVVVQHDTKALFAFTHGRGVFSTSPSSVTSPGWTVENSGISASIYSVKAVSSSVGWVAGAGGQVSVTTNGGSKWNSVGGGAIGTSDIFAVEAVDGNTAFVTTTPAATKIFRTTNGGSTWTNVFTLAGGFIDGIKMFDQSNGIAVGDPVGGQWTILRTTDGGASWARTSTQPSQVGSEAGWNNSVSVIGSQNIWFGTNSGRVYRSTDGGTTWTSGKVQFSDAVSVAFTDTQYGVAGSDSGSTARTTDGGVTWQPVTAGNGSPMYAISATGTDVFATFGGSVYRSGDHGASWSQSYAGSIGLLLAISAVSGGPGVTAWITTSTGSIAEFSGAASGISSPAADAPKTFVLRQNYPNPFNPTTTIEFDLPKASPVSLKIFNSVGEQVATLAEGTMNSGTHRMVWDGRTGIGAAAASGVYFYRIISGGVAETRKMLLIR